MIKNGHLFMFVFLSKIEYEYSQCNVYKSKNQ